MTNYQKNLANIFCYMFIVYMTFILINNLIADDIIIIRYKPAGLMFQELNAYRSDYKIYGEYLYGKVFDQNNLIERFCNNRHASLISLFETKEQIKKCTNNYANRIFDCIYKYCSKSELSISIRF